MHMCVHVCAYEHLCMYEEQNGVVMCGRFGVLIFMHTMHIYIHMHICVYIYAYTCAKKQVATSQCEAVLGELIFMYIFIHVYMHIHSSQQDSTA